MMCRGWKKLRRQLPKEIRALLADTLGQYRLIGLLAALAAAGAVWMWLGMLFVGLDWLMVLPASVRRLLNAVWLLAGFVVGGLLLARRLSPRHPVRWALYVEQLAGGMGGELATSVELVLQPSPHPFADFMLGRVQRRVLALAQPVAVPTQLLGRLLRLLLPAVVAAAAWLAAGRGQFVRGVLRLIVPESPIPAPTAVFLADVQPGDTVLPVGGMLAASCRMQGEGEGAVSLVYEPESGSGERAAAPLVDGRFRASIGPLESTGRYYFEMPGVTVSPAFTVRVLEPPEVVSVRFRVQPPKYTGRLAYEMGPDLTALEGSRVMAMVKTSRRPASGSLVLGSGRTISLAGSADGLSGEFEAEESTTYTLMFSDQHGFASVPFPRRQVLVKPDRPPEVRVTSPADSEVLEGCDVPFVLSVTDDYGIQTVYLEVSAPEAAGRLLGVEPGTGELRCVLSAEFVQPAGAVLAVTPVATDNCPFRRQQVRGQPVQLRIVTETPAAPAPAEPPPVQPDELERLLDTVESLLAAEKRVKDRAAAAQLQGAFRNAAASLGRAAGALPEGPLADTLTELAGALAERTARRGAPRLLAAARWLLAPETRPIAPEDIKPPAAPAGAQRPAPLPPDVQVEELPDPPLLSPGYRRLLESYRSLLPVTRRTGGGKD